MVSSASAKSGSDDIERRMIPRRGRLTAILAVTTILAQLSLAHAQGADPEFIWLSPSTWNIGFKGLLRDLQTAADRGYRLVPLPVTPLLLLVQKSSDGSEPVEYVFASEARDMDAKAAVGYRLVNNNVMVRRKGVTTRTYEYAQVATRLRQSLENELRVAVAKGFRVVDLRLGSVVGLRSFLVGVDDTEFIAILERPAGTTGAAPVEYIVLSSLKVGTMQSELQAAADRGYRLLPFEGAWGATVLLEKFGDPEPIEYLALSTTKTATMQTEMNKASTAGYRFAGTLGRGTREFVVVMQRAKGRPERTHEYVLLGTQRLGTMKRESQAQFARGFRVVGFTTSGQLTTAESVAIFERSLQ